MTLCQLGIVVGILAAVLVNMLIQRMGDATWNTTVGWRWMFFAGIVPALLFVLTIVPVVESPRWLMKIGRRDQALHVLARINGADVATREALEIENSLAIEKGQVSELLPAFRRPLLLCIVLAGLQQISGITPAFSFLPEIFRSAGMAAGHAFFQSVLVSLINLLFTLFPLWLVDRRKEDTHSRRHDPAVHFVCLGRLVLLRSREWSGNPGSCYELRGGPRSATAWRAGSSFPRFIPPRFAGAACPSLPPPFGCRLLRP